MTDNTLDLSHCMTCGGHLGMCSAHTCCRPCACPNLLVSPQIPFLVGWKCPNCGAGMSPFAHRCGCVDPPFTVTCEATWANQVC